MSMSENIYRELEVILNLEPNTIKGDESLADVGWDSMASVMFVALADEKFSLSIPPEKLAAASKISDLHELLAGS